MIPLLHGMSPNAMLRQVASHEAAHLIMLWLMDRPILGCVLTNKGRLTVQLLDETGLKETQNEHILYTMAGLFGEKNYELREDLSEHVNKLDYFALETDCCYMAQKCFKGIGKLGIHLRFENKYGKSGGLLCTW